MWNRGRCRSFGIRCNQSSRTTAKLSSTFVCAACSFPGTTPSQPYLVNWCSYWYPGAVDAMHPWVSSVKLLNCRVTINYYIVTSKKRESVCFEYSRSYSCRQLLYVKLYNKNSIYILVTSVNRIVLLIKKTTKRWEIIKNDVSQVLRMNNYCGVSWNSIQQNEFQCS